MLGGIVRGITSKRVENNSISYADAHDYHHSFGPASILLYMLWLKVGYAPHIHGFPVSFCFSLGSTSQKTTPEAGGPMALPEPQASAMGSELSHDQNPGPCEEHEKGGRRHPSMVGSIWGLIVAQLENNFSVPLLR